MKLASHRDVARKFLLMRDIDIKPLTLIQLLFSLFLLSYSHFDIIPKLDETIISSHDLGFLLSYL